MSERPAGFEDEFWEQSYKKISGSDSPRDDEIGRLERQIGANRALAACIATPGWKAYHDHLVVRFQKLMSSLVDGIKLSESERFYLQGRLFELKEVVADREALEKSGMQMQERLDVLRSERKNQEERVKAQA